MCSMCMSVYIDYDSYLLCGPPQKAALRIASRLAVWLSYQFLSQESKR